MKRVSLISILIFSLIFMVGCGGDDPKKPDPIESPTVDIPDDSLRDAIEHRLDLPSGAPITEEDMRQLTDLYIGVDRTRGVSNLTGLEYATNLRSLSITANPITDLSPLAGLKKLKSLKLVDCPITDISPLTA